MLTSLECIARNVDAEYWLSVPGHPGYEVSDCGRVRSIDRTLTFADGRTRRAPGRLIAPNVTRQGYHYVRFERGVRRPLHAVVLEAFVGPAPDGHEALHGNDVPSDNRLVNLRWGTRSQNIQEAVDRKRHNQARKVTCPRGHRLVHPNLLASRAKEGKRECLACKRAHNHVNYWTHLRGDLDSIADAYYEEILSGKGRQESSPSLEPKRRTRILKLWKVTSGTLTARPESKVKAYGIYVENARRRFRSGTGDRFATVWLDERDGQGWQLYERVDLVSGGDP